MDDATKGHKPGYKSTEFWLSLVAVLAGFVLASGIGGDTKEGEKQPVAQTVAGVVLSALGALGYTKGRTSVKVAEETAKAESSKVAGYLAIAKEKLDDYKRRKADAAAEIPHAVVVDGKPAPAGDPEGA